MLRIEGRQLSPFVVTNEEKSAASGRVDGRSVDAVWCFAIGENRIRKPAAEATVCRHKRLAAVVRDHHAVVVSADENHVGTRWMNSDRVDLELTRSSHHPRVRIAALIGAPETFSGAGEDDSRNGRVLQDSARTARLRGDA